MHIVTLTTCHNRREQTLEALTALHAQCLPDDVTLEHVIVDDGSNDGTAEAIRERFPEVEIIAGNGSLFWAGGMRYGWDIAVKNKRLDFLFVYNDDVDFFDDALFRLFVTSNDFISKHGSVPHVIVGSCCSSDGKHTPYGGQVRVSRINQLAFERINPSSDGFSIVDTLNMNCALIDRKALDYTDFLASYFKHGAADFEFGIRLVKKGGVIVLAPGFFGRCDRNSEPVSPPLKEQTVRSYIASRLQEKKSPFIATFKYFLHHGGLFWPYYFLRQYVTKTSVTLFFSGRWF